MDDLHALCTLAGLRVDGEREVRGAKVPAEIRER
jgi:hypothetical protein